MDGTAKFRGRCACDTCACQGVIRFCEVDSEDLHLPSAKQSPSLRTPAFKSTETLFMMPISGAFCRFTLP